MGIVANNTPAYCCIRTQQTLESMLGANAPGNITQETGVVNSLLSPANTSGFEAVQINSYPGKGLPGSELLPEIEINFLKPACDEISTGQINLCDEQVDNGSQIGYRKYVIDPSHKLKTGFRISQADFDRICEGRDERIAQTLANKAKSLRYQLEREMIKLMLAGAGNYTNGTNSVTTPTSLKLMNVTADGQAYANPAAFVGVKSEYRKMHSMDSPIVVGDDELSRYLDMRSMAGLGKESLGANYGNIGGVTPATSLFLNQTINDNGGTGAHLFSWLPGAAQMVTWNKFVGDWERFGSDYSQTTILLDGIRYDYTLNYEKCDNVWDIGLGITYDLFHLVNELAGCYDWNYILHWAAECGDETCENIFGTPYEAPSVSA